MYKLKGVAQNYDWGVIGGNSIVGQIFKKNGGSIDESKNYAEYWMGTHNNGPSTIESESEWISLSEFISHKYSFTDGLPFLFKVLSINQPLSIQVHPDKHYAEILNKIDSFHYKDDNHKPELAIALSEKFQLLYGLIPLESAVVIVKNILGLQLDDKMFEEINNIMNKFLKYQDYISYKSVISKLVSLDINSIKIMIENILMKCDDFIQGEEQFNIMRKLYKDFGYDRGVLFSLFMNFYNLNKGDSIFIFPNTPHAYIKGDCIECMANSDNVIRLGLTPKFVDITNFSNVF